MDKIKRRGLAVLFAALAVALVAAILLLAVAKPHTTEHFEPAQNVINELNLKKQERAIQQMLEQGGADLLDFVELEERFYESGSSYYVGIIDGVCDARLDGLVATYNSDPATTMKEDASNVRHCLADGILEASLESNENSAFNHFLIWCGQPLTVECKENVTHKDGTTSLAGEQVTLEAVTNFMFALERDDLFAQYKYSWE